MTQVAGKIFISYRRADSAKDARALYERLRREFGEGRVFIDLEGIRPGEDFVEQLERHLEGCDVLVALIGPGWIPASSKHEERRLNEAGDFVRIELSAALTRGIKVFPVLIDGALPLRAEQLPEELKPLVRRQAIVLDFNKFESDVTPLLQAIHAEIQSRALPGSRQGKPYRPVTRGWRTYAFGALFAVGGVGASLLLFRTMGSSGALLAAPSASSSDHSLVGNAAAAISDMGVQKRTDASSPSGRSVLFYNAQSGAGAIASLQGDEVNLVKTFPAGTFSSKWTHVSATMDDSVLFYDATRQAAGVGRLERSDFTTTRSWADGSFGQWSNIVPTPWLGGPLLYNAADGSGAIGLPPSTRVYAQGAFARGWTHIAATNSALLFYNANNGAGGIVVPAGGESGPRSAPALFNDLKTIVSYEPGRLPTKSTHMVSTASGILFYNGNDGSAAVGRIVMGPEAGQAVLGIDQSYRVGSFSTGWTQVAAAGNKIIFYNGSNGALGVGEIASGAFRTTRSYAPNSFAAGWTHLVVAGDPAVKR